MKILDRKSFSSHSLYIIIVSLLLNLKYHFLLFVCLFRFLFGFSICTSHFIQLISYFLSQVSTCTFSIFKAYCFWFSMLIFYYLLCSASMFSFFNHLISFRFAANFKHSWQGTTNAFSHTPLWIIILYEFYSFHCFNWHFFCWSHVSFQFPIPKCLLSSTRTDIFSLFWMIS